jgi:hypothetical protein
MVSFQTKKTQLGYMVEGLGMDNVDIFILVISNILIPLDIFCGHFVIL